MFRRYKDTPYYTFDKCGAERATGLTMGCQHHALGIDDSLSFQPLRHIHDPVVRSWAAEWIAGLLVHEKVTITPEVKEVVWSALGNLATAPAAERTITGLSVLLQSNALRSEARRVGKECVSTCSYRW